MKKRCVVCGNEIETEITMGTEVFVVAQNPCICSVCAVSLGETAHERGSTLKEYKKRMKSIGETLLSKYPNGWTENIEEFMLEYLIQTLQLIGKEITKQEAIIAIEPAKKLIAAGHKENKGLGELKENENRRPTFRNKGVDDFDFFSFKKDGTLLLAEIEEESEEENSFKSTINEVKKIVKGQDDAVEEIGRIIFHNQKCIKYNSQRHAYLKLKKQNALIVGPTGTGKTLIVTEFCRILDIPYVIVDMTTYTKAGYVGGNIEDIFLRLIEKAGGDLKRAQNGIIMLDEGDKNEAKNEERGADVGGKGLVDSLLKKIEGCEIDLGKGKTFNSTNTTFFLAGVFPRLYEIRRERVLGKRSIGFCANTEEIRELGEFVSDDFEKHGFSQEYVGRFESIVELNNLSDQVYLAILNSKNSPCFQYKQMFKYAYGVNLEISQECKMMLIEQAKKYNIGARGLFRSMAKFLRKAEVELLKADKKYKKVKINKECDVIIS